MHSVKVLYKNVIIFYSCRFHGNVKPVVYIMSCWTPILVNRLNQMYINYQREFDKESRKWRNIRYQNNIIADGKSHVVVQPHSELSVMGLWIYNSKSFQGWLRRWCWQRWHHSVAYLHDPGRDFCGECWHQIHTPYKLHCEKLWVIVRFIWQWDSLEK